MSMKRARAPQYTCLMTFLRRSGPTRRRATQQARKQLAPNVPLPRAQHFAQERMRHRHTMRDRPPHRTAARRATRRYH
eukprot:6895327-Prymnesium_polylepis.2